jgi:hydrogenase maturation protease
LPTALKRPTLPGPGKTLVCGFGNPGRQDDGLGPVLVARLEEEPALRGRPDVETEARLQLNIEDALTVSRFDRVIFVDASTRGRDPFLFKEIRPTTRWSFTTHSLAPGSVLALCRELYGRAPRAYLLAVRGHRWELEEGLSDRAARNLDRAVSFLLRRLARPPGSIDNPSRRRLK